jgi:transposase
MYLNKFKNHGTEYIRVLESYTTMVNGEMRTRKRIIKSLGRVSKYDDGKGEYFERLREAFKEGKALIPELEEFVQQVHLVPAKIEIDREDPEQYLSHPKNIGYLLIENVLKKLNVIKKLKQYKETSKIEYDLVGIFSMLVIGRILKPESKKATISSSEKCLVDICEGVSEKDIYRSLDVFYDLNINIQRTMDSAIAKSEIGRNRELTYYDVTNFFFHIDEEDDFRKRGKSKENRVEPIIQLGLFIDDNGIPVAHKEFAGNQIDQTTLRPAVKETIKEFELSKLVIVADGGMNSAKNRSYLKDEGHGYIVSKSVKTVDKDTRDWITSLDEYKTRNGESPEEYKWKYKSRIVKSKVKNENYEQRELVEKEVVFFSPDYYLRQLKEHEDFKKFLHECIENPGKIKSKRFAVSYLNKEICDAKSGKIKEGSEEKVVYSVNKEKLKQQENILGYYLIKTSELNMSDLEVIEKYRGLSRIEDSFRIAKSNLNCRPVYVRTEKHIIAHFLICFVALAVVRILQVELLKAKKEKNKTKQWKEGITEEKLQEGLRLWQADLLGKDQYRLTEPTKELKELFDVIGIKWNEPLPNQAKIKRMVNEFKKL